MRVNQQLVRRVLPVLGARTARCCDGACGSVPRYPLSVHGRHRRDCNAQPLTALLCRLSS